MTTKKLLPINRPFHIHLSALIELCPKTQSEISKELGYKNANIISMFKIGKTKVPLIKIPLLAKALDADPEFLLRYALREYMPDLLDYFDERPEFPVTESEKEFIRELRILCNDTEPVIRNVHQRQALAEFARSVMSSK